MSEAWGRILLRYESAEMVGELEKFLLNREGFIVLAKLGHTATIDSSSGKCDIQEEPARVLAPLGRESWTRVYIGHPSRSDIIIEGTMAEIVGVLWLLKFPTDHLEEFGPR